MINANRARKQVAVAATATAAIGVAGPAVFPAAAAARHPNETCPGHTLCEWADGGFNGPVQWWSSGGSDRFYSNDTFSSNHSVGLDDQVDAVWNNGPRWVALFSGKDFSQVELCLGPGAAVRDLDFVGISPTRTWHNDASSHFTSVSQPAGCNTTIAGPGAQGCSM